VIGSKNCSYRIIGSEDMIIWRGPDFLSEA
jgi:hypothetical protein